MRQLLPYGGILGFPAGLAPPTSSPRSPMRPAREAQEPEEPVVPNPVEEPGRRSLRSRNSDDSPD